MRISKIDFHFEDREKFETSSLKNFNPRFNVFLFKQEVELKLVDIT